MNSKTKIWLVVAMLLMVAGVLIFLVSMVLNGWNLELLSTVKYETNEHEITDVFNSISVKTDTADINFILSEDGKSKVICHEPEKENHSVTVKSDTLIIESQKNKKWYEYIGISFDSPGITIYLTENEYLALNINGSTGDIVITKDFSFESIDITVSTGSVKNYASASGKIKIESSTGNIYTEGVSANEIALSVSTGSVTACNVKCARDFVLNVSTGKSEIKDIECKNLISNGNTGEFFLKNVIVSEKMSIERSTGDIEIDGCDACEIWIKTDTGDVNGTLLSDKVFIVESDTGRKDVPESVTGGKCEITTDTGDIKIKIKR